MKRLLSLFVASLLASGAIAQTAIAPGSYFYPARPFNFGNGNAMTMDAAAEKAAFVGRVFFNGRPAGTKTFDNSANTKIGFWATSVTFANGSTTIDLCIQGVSASGPLAQPDGTCQGSVKRTLTGGIDTITANAFNEFALNTAGTSFTLSHGDLVSVVLDMTARGGADSVAVATAGITGGSTMQSPLTNVFLAGAWATSVANGSGQTPQVVLTANDGTLAVIDSSYGLGTYALTAWADSTNPDERAECFQFPYGVKVDALWMMQRPTDANSDGTITLFSGSDSSPSSLASVNFTAEQLGSTTEGLAVFNLASEVTLAANTEYCTAVRATGTGSVRMTIMTMASAGHRVFLPGGTTMQSRTRDGGSGAFGAASTTIHYPIGVRVSAITTTTNAGFMLQ